MSKKIIAIDAGHGAKTLGKRCLISIDPAQTREWHLNSRIADKVQKMLVSYDCKVIRVDDTTGAKDISLSNRVKTANNANADIYISIHHNAGIKGGSGGGTVVYYHGTKRREEADTLYRALTSKTKLVGNRAEKVINKGFYVLKHTKMPAFLLENGFMDSRTDTPVILTASHAEKTAQGIVSFLVAELALEATGTAKPAAAASYIHNSVDYSPVFDAVYYADRYGDLKATYGNNAAALFNHFIAHGMMEGRQAIDTFNVRAYRSRYPDLQKAFGDNLPAYYLHYIQLGRNEKRIAI